MADLGEFKAATRSKTPDEVSTFTFHGVKVAACLAGMDGLPMMELAANGMDEDDADVMSTTAAFYEFLHAVIADKDWAKFRRACIKDKVGSEELAELVGWLMEQATGRPTERSSDSSGGPSVTTGSSSTTPSATATSPAPVSALHPVSA